ncbi:MAG: hypothetical protein CM15mP60_1500 [Alphaproteobacteria bacterium]|nr:MAG: hypothetical protein CM15mP60_1500 [Alphaproteobacteria bacterium]
MTPDFTIGEIFLTAPPVPSFSAIFPKITCPVPKADPRVQFNVPSSEKRNDEGNLFWLSSVFGNFWLVPFFPGAPSFAPGSHAVN